MIHSREAAADTMEIMKKYGKDLNGVIHCYSYSPEMAQEYVKMGYFIGVGGVVTFKNAKKLKETVKEIPLESIVLETDCPYLAQAISWQKKLFALHFLCGRENCRIERDLCGGSHPADRGKCKAALSDQ